MAELSVKEVWLLSTSDTVTATKQSHSAIIAGSNNFTDNFKYTSSIFSLNIVKPLFWL